jgi:hypothetical protein
VLFNRLSRVRRPSPLRRLLWAIVLGFATVAVVAYLILLANEETPPRLVTQGGSAILYVSSPGVGAQLLVVLSEEPRCASGTYVKLNVKLDGGPGIGSTAAYSLLLVGDAMLAGNMRSTDDGVNFVDGTASISTAHTFAASVPAQLVLGEQPLSELKGVAGCLATSIETRSDLFIAERLPLFGDQADLAPQSARTPVASDSATAISMQGAGGDALNTVGFEPASFTVTVDIQKELALPQWSFDRLQPSPNRADTATRFVSDTAIRVELVARDSQAEGRNRIATFLGGVTIGLFTGTLVTLIPPNWLMGRKECVTMPRQQGDLDISARGRQAFPLERWGFLALLAAGALVWMRRRRRR